jgi:hypothetical protein
MYSLYDVLRPKYLSEMRPESVFKQLICSPIPTSVSNITAKGTLMFTGDGAVIAFTIRPEDLPDLLARARFEPTDSERLQPFRYPIGESRSYRLFEKQSAGFGEMKWMFLHVDTNSWECRVFYTRI